jgi:hypothetical protein
MRNMHINTGVLMTRRVLFALFLVWISLGCSTFDPNRVPVARGTLGEEIVRVFCERMASEANPTDVMGLRWKPVCRGEAPLPSDAPPRLAVLMDNRVRLARALDQVLPEAITDDLAHFMGELLPLYDPPGEHLPRNTELIAELMDLLIEDQDALAALARVGTRKGYAPRHLALGLMQSVLAYPEFDDFTGLVLRTLVDLPAEEDATDGIAAAEMRELQRALAFEMATFELPEPAPAGQRTTLELTRELLARQDPLFGISPTPRWAVVRDSRGMAMPAGGIVAPFVDMNADGLADIDALGRFADASGAPLDIPSPFYRVGEAGVPRDSGGRALRSDTTRYYDYIDVEHSLLAGVLRESTPLFDPASPAVLQLARGIPPLLGPDTTLHQTYGSASLAYTGPDTDRGSLLDFVHALSVLIPRDTTDEALALTETLMRDHEPPIAALIAAADHMIDRGDSYPDARLAQPNVLWDDVIEVGIDFSQQPGLLEALMRSFTNPQAARLGPVLGEMMRHRDRVTFNPSNPNGPPMGWPLDERVDRTMGDVENNESVMQRTLALIHALDGVRMCNREGARLNLSIQLGPISVPLTYPLPFLPAAGECELIDIPNVAEAYSDAILGNFELELQSGLLAALTDIATSLGVDVDGAVEISSGINGLTLHPTPQALNRLVFWGLENRPGQTCSPSTPEGCNSEFAGQLFAPLRDRHGNDVIDTYHGTIFAWEQPGFYEGIAPLLDVLLRPEYRTTAGGEFRFGRFITTVHRHWATEEHWLTQSTTPTGRNFSYQSGARRYEENIADGLIDASLLGRLHTMTATLDGIELAPGRDAIRVLAEATQDLIDPARNVGLTTRDGRATIPRNDGSRAMAVTPLLLVLDALRNMDRALDAAPERRDSWRSGRNGLATRFLGTQPLGTEYRLENQRGRAILLHVLPFIRERLAEHRSRGDLEEWSRDLVPDTAELVRSPLVSALVRFLDRVQDDPDAPGALSRFVTYLTSEPSENDAFGATLVGAADLVQLLDETENIVPLTHALAHALAPDVHHVVGGHDPELDIDNSVAGDGLALVRRVQSRDSRHVLRVILNNLVAFPENDDALTPLEEILDVMGELNRVTVGSSDTFTAGDYEILLGSIRDFIRDERRGLRRLFNVVQEREIP